MDEKTKEITEMAMRYRGLVLESCIVLEKVVDTFLTRYFCLTEKLRNDFIVLILDRTSLDAKISITEALLSDLFGKDHYKTTYKKLISELRIVKDERNKFAHFLTDKYNPESINKFPKSVTFIGFRNSTKLEDYNNHKVTELLVRIDRIGDEFIKLMKAVKASRAEPAP